MTASLYTKYNTFSDRESEQQHRTMTFAELPNHPPLLTMVGQNYGSLVGLLGAIHTSELDRSQFALRKCSHSFRSISVSL